ncbi:MAG: MerR family transcriptional regulator [Calditrichia bacterium]
MEGMKKNGHLKVRDVCKLVGISPHTLRYWEKEFSGYLQPPRTPGGHRLYDDHNLRKLLEIKHLLKDQFYSIKGVKKILRIELNA